jgi:hypothetical protein
LTRPLSEREGWAQFGREDEVKMDGKRRESGWKITKKRDRRVGWWE